MTPPLLILALCILPNVYSLPAQLISQHKVPPEIPDDDILGSFDFFDALIGENGFLSQLVPQGFNVPFQQEQDSPFEGSVPPPDFGQIINGIFSALRDKRYGDPAFSDLPRLGLCDKDSCKDLYDFLESFRQSEMFVNFQTLLQLLQDEEGPKLLGDLLLNPGALQDVIKLPEKDQKPDFPEVSFSIDEPNYYDYYSEGSGFKEEPTEKIANLRIAKPQPETELELDPLWRFTDYYDYYGQEEKTAPILADAPRTTTEKVTTDEKFWRRNDEYYDFYYTD